jgi:hypothetical protein
MVGLRSLRDLVPPYSDLSILATLIDSPALSSAQRSAEFLNSPVWRHLASATLCFKVLNSLSAPDRGSAHQFVEIPAPGEQEFKRAATVVSNVARARAEVHHPT